MAGVARRTIIAELQRYCLVASVLKPATAASRWDVSRNARTTHPVLFAKGKELEQVRKFQDNVK
jgi:hypothetical protein